MHFKIINKISRRDIRMLVFIAIASSIAGCSSDTMRLTDGLFTSSTSSKQTKVSNRPIEQPSPIQQAMPSVQSVKIESNALPQPQDDMQETQYNMQEPQKQAQASQYPSQPVYAVAGTGAPPRNLGVIPVSALYKSRPAISVNSRNYTVQSGDTLSAIALRYGTPVKDIINTNGLSSGAIRVGQKLIIPNNESNYAKSDVAATKVSVVPVGVSRTQVMNAQANASKADTPERNLAVPQKTISKDLAHNQQANLIETVSVRMDNPTSSSQTTAPTSTQQASVDNTKQNLAVQTPVRAQAQNAISTKDDSIAKVEKVAALTPQATGIAQMRWPVRGRILSSFGQREGTITNDGLDILVPENTSVSAVENGVVIYAGDGLKEFGNTVLIRHENNIVTVYGHNSKILVKRNQQVRRGEEIAKSGMSGNASTPKLHFEVRQNSVPVNPAKFLENQ